MRVVLLERLIEAPTTATELARSLPVTRSAVSQHLQVLKAAGLVADTPAGTSRVYAVEPDPLALLHSCFDSFWTRSLDSFRRTAEGTAPDPFTREGGRATLQRGSARPGSACGDRRDDAGAARRRQVVHGRGLAHHGVLRPAGA